MRNRYREQNVLGRGGNASNGFQWSEGCKAEMWLLLCCGFWEEVFPIHNCISAMRASSRLLQHSARLTLFTRANCSLCDTAKSVISSLGKKRSFEINEIDVMARGQKQWKDLYEFDTPVVGLQLFRSLASPVDSS